MNVSNLQLQGLYLAIAAINQSLVAKGMLSRDELGLALQRAEQVALGDERLSEDMTPANRDAVAFAARFLLLANAVEGEELPPFSDLARQVGKTKGHYPDEL